MDPLISDFQQAILECFGIHAEPSAIHLQPCNASFQMDFTFVIFSWTKTILRSPDEIGDSLGTWLLSHQKIDNFQVVKGFLNFKLTDNQWHSRWTDFQTILQQANIEHKMNVPGLLSGNKTMIEYCSPNTNKPLHLGHIRNILLGWSLFKIHQFTGGEVCTSQIINDRGVAICKSMLAWKLWGQDETPEKSGIKSDHFVGHYYVLFDKKLQEEYGNWLMSQEAQQIQSISFPNLSKEEFKSKYKNEYFNRHSVLGSQISKMLLDWEAKSPEVRSLWQKMNQWVYQGFQKTYAQLGVHFDFSYYESDTYLLGKETIQEGLNKGVFYKEQDSSVWVNLEDVGLDRKILIRSNGTSLYITQDLGTAIQRDENHKASRYIYVVGDEQDYHFRVLFETLKKLGKPFADKLFHLSYGMVDLPEGKMKSREGTVVDADELIERVVKEARESAEERGEIAILPKEEQEKIFNLIGLAALKYFILKVHPKKRMLFNPKEAVDMQGHTGPYIVNAYVRIQSILRKQLPPDKPPFVEYNLHERLLMRQAMDFPSVLKECVNSLDPSHLANYLYQLAKEFHRYYHDHSILHAETEDLRNSRLFLSKWVGEILKQGMSCLGIEMPDRM